MLQLLRKIKNDLSDYSHKYTRNPRDKVTPDIDVFVD